MPRAKSITLASLMAKADVLHNKLTKVTEEYNRIILQAQVLQRVIEDVGQGAFVYVGADYCEVLLKRYDSNFNRYEFKVLRKCNEPELSYIDVVRDFEVTALPELTELD